MRYTELTQNEKRHSDIATCIRFNYILNHLKAGDSPTGKKETQKEFADRVWDEKRHETSLKQYKKEKGRLTKKDISKFPNTQQ